MALLTLTTRLRSAMWRIIATLPLQWLLGLMGGILIVWLVLYHQPYYPATWIDEGFVMQGAINLVRHGQYAMRSLEEFRVLDQPLIANGPGIVLPIAGSFLLFGIGLMQARIVVFIYFVVATLAFFLLARRLFGLVAACISLFLLFAVPQEGFLFYGRQALGNVPALGYFLVGYLLWLTGLERARWLYVVGAGVLFGLAIITKGQHNLLIPAFFAVALLDWLYFKAIGIKNIFLVLATVMICVGLWYGIQLLLVGWDNFDQHLEAIRSSSQVTVAAFRPSRILGNLGYLVRSGLVFVVGPGLLWALWTCRYSTLAYRRQGLLIVLVFLWLFWYAFISVGWPRYSFDPYVIGLLFVGKFIVDSPIVRSIQHRAMKHQA